MPDKQEYIITNGYNQYIHNLLVIKKKHDIFLIFDFIFFLINGPFGSVRQNLSLQ